MALFGGKDSGKKNEAEPAPVPSAPRPATGTTGNSNSSREAKRDAQPGEMTVANIGKSIAINGDLTGNEDMVIEGSVEGSIDLPNNQLTIGANGTVKAEVHAKSVIIVGHVVGNINGIERVEIHATGRVEGNVSAPKLVVTEGAQLDGVIHMSGTDSAISDAGPRPTPATVASEEVRKTA